MAGDASLSELLEVEVLDHRVPERAGPPLYVQPQQDEALGSWWHRLAGRFGLTAQCLCSAVMGSDLVLTRDWSIRPAFDLLALAHDRTGIPMDTLRPMTFLDWAESSHFDEALGRFTGRRYMDGPPKSPTRGLVVCAECLRSDAQPYLRLNWLIGWMAICPIHSKAMTSRCPACRVPLALPMPRSLRSLQAERCASCGFDLRTAEMPRAVQAAQRLQSVLLEGKRTGMTNLTGIGPVSWQDLLMLSDVVLGMFWQGTSVEQKWWLCEEIAQDVGAGDRLDAGSGREGSLALLEWFLGAWSGNQATELVTDLVRRWRAGGWRQACLNVGPTIDDVRTSRVSELLSVLTG